MGSDLKMPSVQRQVESVATSGTEPPMGIDLERAAARWEDEGHCPSVDYVALARELAEALRGIGESLDTIEAQERYDNDPDSFTEDLIEVARAATTKARAAGLVT